MDWLLENRLRRQSPLQLPLLQLRPLQLRPLQLRPLQLRNVPDVPRLNVAPPRAGIDLMCPPPWPPPPRRGSAFVPDAANVTAAKQLKKSMSFAFIECLSLMYYTPENGKGRRFFPTSSARSSSRQIRGVAGGQAEDPVISRPRFSTR